MNMHRILGMQIGLLVKRIQIYMEVDLHIITIQRQVTAIAAGTSIVGIL